MINYSEQMIKFLKNRFRVKKCTNELEVIEMVLKCCYGKLLLPKPAITVTLDGWIYLLVGFHAGPVLPFPS